MLSQAGIRVDVGLMEAEAEELNVGFLTRHRKGVPFVRVKVGMSLDGRTALANGKSKWITGDVAREDVQYWRARSSAVLTGIGTVLADDPKLNVRMPGVERQPMIDRARFECAHAAQCECIRWRRAGGRVHEERLGSRCGGTAHARREAGNRQR